MKLIFAPPSSDEPGFLRRQRTAIDLHAQFKEDPTVETLDKLVDFLLNYVQEPEDRDTAREYLWDASENQINELVKAIVGGDENPT